MNSNGSRFKKLDEKVANDGGAIEAAHTQFLCDLLDAFSPEERAALHQEAYEQNLGKPVQTQAQRRAYEVEARRWFLSMTPETIAQVHAEALAQRELEAAQRAHDAEQSRADGWTT